MSHYVALCHVISRHVTSCHVMTRDVPHGTPCHVMSYHVMSRHVTSCPVMSRHVISCYVISRRKSRDGHATNASLSTDFFHMQSIQIKHDRVRWLSRRLPIQYRFSGIWSSYLYNDCLLIAPQVFLVFQFNIFLNKTTTTNQGIRLQIIDILMFLQFSEIMPTHTQVDVVNELKWFTCSRDFLIVHL